MSGEVPKPKDDDAIANELFARVQAVRFDANFQDMLSMVDKAQKAIDGLSNHQWSDVNDHMSDLYNVWELSDWSGQPVKVSGKMRPSGFSESIVGAIPDGFTVRHDEKGLYYLVENVTMAALGFIVDSQEDRDLSEYHPVVFSLTPVDEYDEDLAGEDGLYVMHPSDILSIEFPDLSLKAARYNLKYHFPEIYHQVKKHIKDGASSERAIVQGLKELEIICDETSMHGYDLLASLNLYIYSRIDFDDMGYEIKYDGPIGALMSDDDIAEALPPTSRYGKIIPAQVCGIMMEQTEDGSYRPTLVVAVPCPDIYEGFEAYLVPAESLMSMRSLRPRASQLGNVALQIFDELSDVSAYFSGRGAIFVEDKEGIADQERQDAESTEREKFNQMFVQMTERVQADIPKVVAYDERYGHYRVSLEDDIQQLLFNYDTVIKATPSDLLTGDFYLNVCKEMVRSLGKRNTLKIGDTIVTHGTSVVIDTVDEEQESLVLSGGEFVRGTFCGFAISEVPDLAMRITEGETGMTNPDLTILIRDVEYTSVDGDVQLDVFTAAEVALPLSREAGSTIFKVLKESDDE
ncbi:MAG: hypothetical protein ABIP74_03510 [Candidatus Saccharimonas sp.]